MLERIGGECAGAVTFLPAGELLPVCNDHYRALTSPELARILKEFPRRPLLAGETGIRLSLAGAQDKIAVRVEGDAISLPLSGAPSTHVLKPAVERFAGVVFNEAWRIAKTTDIRKAFSGEGSRVYGGRWNSKGIAVVYAAATRSLAMLEILVHMRNTRQTVPPIPYMLIPASFDERLIEELPPSNLPPDWDIEPSTDSTKSIGDAWVSAASSPVLSVPSVIVPEERNYILNPGHDLFAQIQLGSPVPCKFDLRLL